MYEVEIKSRVRDLPKLVARIESLQARPLAEIEQADEYFNHPCRDFQETDEALRVRTVGADSVMTYKGPKLAADTKTRREIEFPLVGGTRDQCRECLIALGFRPVATVRKRRKRWLLDLHDHQFEIACDEVDELGTFCEVETQADDETRAGAIEATKELARTLELHELTTRSYLELLLDVRRET